MPGARKTLYIAFGLLVVMLVVFTVAGFSIYLKNKRYERGFSSIKIGDSEESVLAAMGKPDKVDICRIVSSAADSAEDRRYQEQCAGQYSYNAFLKPYVISFDKNKRVLAKGYQISP